MIFKMNQRFILFATNYTNWHEFLPISFVVADLTTCITQQHSDKLQVITTAATKIRANSCNSWQKVTIVYSHGERINQSLKTLHPIGITLH
ncbi:MAG: hypothetical protein JWQ30_1228 [Sediminibacterium sp.]|nr:hypothetical protein [Sediminibacterium sp.]